MPNFIQELKNGYETRSVLIIDDDKEVVDSLEKIMKIFFQDCIATIDAKEGYEEDRSCGETCNIKCLHTKPSQEGGGCG